jgi:hypothetical protein
LLIHFLKRRRDSLRLLKKKNEKTTRAVKKKESEEEALERTEYGLQFIADVSGPLVQIETSGSKSIAPDTSGETSKTSNPIRDRTASVSSLHTGSSTTSLAKNASISNLALSLSTASVKSVGRVEEVEPLSAGEEIR